MFSHYKERLDVNFYYVGIDSSHNFIGSHQNVESGGTASKWFSSLNDGGNPAYSYKGLGYDYIGIWFVEVEDQYYKITSDQWIFSTINTPVNNQKPIVEIDIPWAFKGYIDLDCGKRLNRHKHTKKPQIMILWFSLTLSFIYRRKIERSMQI